MVEKDHEAKGVLIDLDLAVLVVEGDTQQYRPVLGGTLPFLSVDLLVDPPPRYHLCRYDLESFVFVLGWILIRFDEEGLEARPDGFSDWYIGARTKIRLGKSGFFSWPTSEPGSRFPSLQKTWLWQLCRLFRDGYSMRDEMQDTGSFDNETLGGYVTYDTFLKILQ